MPAKKPADYDELDRMRHSAAHLLAAAVMKLFPDAKLGVGPVIENGFYYDMQLPRPLTTDDFKTLERTIAALKAENLDFRRQEMPLDEAIAFSSRSAGRTSRWTSSPTSRRTGPPT